MNVSQAHPRLELAAGEAHARSATTLRIDTAVFVLTFATLAFFWRDVALATLLLAALSAVGLAMTRSRRRLFIFAFGFFAASAAEIVQVMAGAYAYNVASPLVIPYYNFPLWGVVMLFADTTLGRIEQALGGHLPSVSVAVLAGELSVYLFATALLVGFAGSPFLVATLFALMLLGRLVLGHAQGDMWIALVGLLFGPLSEAFLVRLGIYGFAHPFVLGLPAWHPIYWMLIALFLRRLRAATRR